MRSKNKKNFRHIYTYLSSVGVFKEKVSAILLIEQHGFDIYQAYEERGDFAFS